MSSPPPEPKTPEVENDVRQLPSNEPLDGMITNTSTDNSGLIDRKDDHDPQYSSKILDGRADYADDVLLQSSIASLDSGGQVAVQLDNPRLSVPWQRHTSRSPAPPRTVKGRWDAFWLRNKGVALVMLSQFFGAAMSAATRLLETSGSGGNGMHPLQIIFARMSITSVLCFLYMRYKSVPHSPLGRREVRGLLVARGVGGFFGGFGLYYSLLYLPIAEATVLTFLAPIVACFACSFLIDEPFTRMEQVAGLVSLCGVVLIARPISYFTSSGTTAMTAATATVPSDATLSSIEADLARKVTSVQRLSAVGMAMLGVLGAASAYTTIRWIGKRAHPLISVNYFAVWCTIVSTVGLVVIPNIGFELPANFKEWLLLISIGFCGFVMQFLLTAGLQHEKSSRATNMVYTLMLFALGFDKVIWGTSPGAVSIMGSSLILGSAIYVAVQKEVGKKNATAASGSAEEGRGMLAGGEHEEDDEEDEYRGRGELRGVQEVQLREIRV